MWAYIPTAVMPNLHKLADVKYGSNPSQPHTSFVDGKAVQGDVKIGGAWKTIFVGGLNKGGRAYYALDNTDPDEPRALWEFAHDDSAVHNNLRLSYRDPVISKLGDGTWTVAFGSGYNNVAPGDGQGRLYVVNAATGAVERNIATTGGTMATPSGLSKINVWRAASSDNTAQRYYAGDLLGNVWRFDIDGLVAPHQSALRLAQMEDARGAALPITTEIKLREYERQPIIAVATGRCLEYGLSRREVIQDTRPIILSVARKTFLRMAEIDRRLLIADGAQAASPHDWTGPYQRFGDRLGAIEASFPPSPRRTMALLKIGGLPLQSRHVLAALAGLADTVAMLFAL